MFQSRSNSWKVWNIDEDLLLNYFETLLKRYNQLLKTLNTVESNRWLYKINREKLYYYSRISKFENFLCFLMVNLVNIYLFQCFFSIMARKIARKIYIRIVKLPNIVENGILNNFYTLGRLSKSDIFWVTAAANSQICTIR